MISFTGAQVIRTRSKQHYDTLKSYALNATSPSFHFEPQLTTGTKKDRVYTGLVLTGEHKEKVMEYRGQVRYNTKSRDFMKIVDCFEDYMMRLRKAAGPSMELKSLEDLRKIAFLQDLNLSHIDIFKNIKIR